MKCNEPEKKLREVRSNSLDRGGCVGGKGGTALFFVAKEKIEKKKMG